MADVLACPAMDAPALVCDPGVLDPGGIASDLDHYAQLVGADLHLPWADRMETAFFAMLSQWPAEAVEAVRFGPWRTIAEKPDQFVEAALASYSRYVLDSLEAALDWIAGIADHLLSMPETALCLGSSSMQQLVAMVFGESTSGVEVSRLVEACPDVAPLLETFDAVSAFVARLRTTLAQLDSGSWDDAVTFMAELIVTGAEMAGQPEVQTAIVAFLHDPAALGRVVGTIAGVLMWEVISTVATVGLNKVKALGRIGATLATVAEFGL